MTAKSDCGDCRQIRKPRADKPYRRARVQISPKPYLPDTAGTERHPSKSVAVAAACCSCFPCLMAFSPGAPFSPTA
ncbi:MOSC domain protein [Aspergillus luchuensis]|uniref:MOSC domain protein n=1 Tax=Aspergillus kawachii TaxID=1069201 RepID=A0A146F7E2_ASPKA|nr:MOSC domain protein [Aspergillus luchuensis]